MAQIYNFSYLHPYSILSIIAYPLLTVIFESTFLFIIPNRSPLCIIFANLKFQKSKQLRLLKSNNDNFTSLYSRIPSPGPGPTMGEWMSCWFLSLSLKVLPKNATPITSLVLFSPALSQFFVTASTFKCCFSHSYSFEDAYNAECSPV